MSLNDSDPDPVMVKEKDGKGPITAKDASGNRDDVEGKDNGPPVELDSEKDIDTRNEGDSRPEQGRRPSQYQTSRFKRLFTPKICQWDPESPRPLGIPLAYLYAFVRKPLFPRR